ncbi:MAG: hypothetical protein F6K40_12250 [Okeania sp. SIO3I5]|uniref:hypothetical protein n=1 Tax=Okeania sp. SIO3I5 TaxID=2607805 RepID=UPI0013B96CD8|nr:hypothetical protein [Okeania sp. SIO3I5]NEQ37001.1 hypothetical protein [Okeania sp. SIO3I5]
MGKRRTQKDSQPPNPEFSGDRGLNVDPDAGTGLPEARMLTINNNRPERGESVLSKILIATGYHTTIVVPNLLLQGLGINTTSELTAARTRLGIADTVKVYKPRANKAAEEDEEAEAGSGRAQTDLDGDPSMSRKGGKMFTVMFAEPLDANYNGKEQANWIKCSCVRTGGEVSLAAIGIWLSKFPEATKIPPKFKLSGRWLYPGDYTDKLTKVNETGK